MRGSPERLSTGTLALLMAAAVACDLPPIPLYPPRDLEPPVEEPEPEPELEPEPPFIRPLCEAGHAYCWDERRALRCSFDGQNFEAIACDERSRCERGACVRPASTCAPGELLRLEPRELVFAPTEDLKAQTATVEVTSCAASDVQLRVASIAPTPLHDDGTPVFSFEAVAPQGLTLPPGQSLSVKLLFRPRHALYQDASRLRIVAQGERVVEQEVALRTRALCLSASPSVELGPLPIREPLRAPWSIVNCGTEPLILDELKRQRDEDDAATFDLALLDARGAEALGAVLRPGERLEATLVTTHHEVGLIQSHITLHARPALPTDDSPPARLSARARLRGFAHAPAALGCQPASTPPPRRSDAMHDPSDLIKIEPWALNLLIPSSPSAYLYAWSPDAPALLLATQDHHIWALATRVQDYTLHTLAIDPLGVPSCHPHTTTLIARPSDPLYVELAWRAEDDPLPSDEGPGLGPDLDLYAHFDRVQLTPWRSQDAACAAPLLLDRTPASCASGRAALLTTSRSGAGVEALRVHASPPQRVDLGVQLRALHGFSGASATLRVWRYGQLDDALDALNPIPIHTLNSLFYVGVCESNNTSCTRLGTTLTTID